MNMPDVAQQLTHKLELDKPPIALAFVASKPDGIDDFDGAVPSACSFWPRAQSATFYASAEQHHNCPVGAMTMGFDLPDEVRDGLMGIVQKMCADDYLVESEAGAIPHVEEPHVILLWLSPRQAMLYNEAAGSATWSSSMTPSLFGRPTCAALPAAMNAARPTMSLGCIGMRTFTGAPADAMVAAIAGADADRFVEALDRTAAANAVMLSFYESHKAQFG
jgi:uncharacterized protein (DUF169 family)